jgi:hypothetical protein
MNEKPLDEGVGGMAELGGQSKLLPQMKTF